MFRSSTRLKTIFEISDLVGLKPVCFALKARLARDTKYDGFSGQFFRVFEIIIFCFVVAIFDLVHDVAAIHCICLLLTASGNLF